MGSPNPGKAGSDTAAGIDMAAEHGFVNQKIKNLKKNTDYQWGIWTKNEKIKNVKKTPITSTEFEPKSPNFENWSWIFFR